MSEIFKTEEFSQAAQALRERQAAASYVGLFNGEYNELGISPRFRVSLGMAESLARLKGQ